MVEEDKDFDHLEHFLSMYSSADRAGSILWLIISYVGFSLHCQKQKREMAIEKVNMLKSRTRETIYSALNKSFLFLLLLPLHGSVEAKLFF